MTTQGDRKRRSMACVVAAMGIMSILLAPADSFPIYQKTSVFIVLAFWNLGMACGLFYAGRWTS
jgi:hypothetical protein